MGELSDTWVIKLAQKNIGLHGVDDAPPSILRIDDGENTVKEIHRVDWDKLSEWALQDYSDSNREWLKKRADITINGVSHVALFGIFPDGTGNLNVEVEEATQSEPTGSARGIK